MTSAGEIEAVNLIVEQERRNIEFINVQVWVRRIHMSNS